MAGIINERGKKFSFNRNAMNEKEIVEKSAKPLSEKEDIKFSSKISRKSIQHPSFGKEKVINFPEKTESEKQILKESVDKIIKKVKKFATLFQRKKYLYVLFPIFFLLLFLITEERPHQGEIKIPGFSYSGLILKDEPNGKGKIFLTNGDTYTGTFKDGKFDGQGVYSSKNGKWRYSGKFVKGLASGKGLMKTPDGKSHSVTYRNGALVQ